MADVARMTPTTRRKLTEAEQRYLDAAKSRDVSREALHRYNLALEALLAAADTARMDKRAAS